ncbi:dUTP diphosphatase [Paracoccus sp. (in: a-proteobacteria)]|uniref:dUTP diphosphatase n=1 Tax=Paracoccus sp. TaxID=267 RepID=UPI0026E0C71A|nr:dUTP diphosphatase [Paracoccus sp. (in: a-proteobacteria)]MDO5646468.1 dUTP diphosphatase [Paracoccus sp. (in: a-proteobacteria)]
MPDAPLIRLMRLPGSDADMPCYQTAGAAGADLRAWLPDGSVTLRPGGRALIATGLALHIPTGYEAQIRPRSGLALKHGVTVANAPGTIDCDYRGPLGVILINLGDVDFTVAHGDRIAQMVIAPAPQARFEWADELTPTERGAGGFGSTGAG